MRNLFRNGNDAVPEKPVRPPALEGFALQCASCRRRAEILYKGTSWCVNCYQEKSRMGQTD